MKSSLQKENGHCTLKTGFLETAGMRKQPALPLAESAGCFYSRAVIFSVPRAVFR
ncbi:hypothetical protein HMPREF9098_1757 [Kingella denitrificans ATCC 33394]|uniref:Uncharacterized protein n=1 Tax=Kingella denitrificans ATCC 33394 TaxID=888741 RepID=F0F0X2_9NEIS|nr:hypothetical protein HMPREF9098_1757 [Kingella denitrificans ATCC 33394]